MPDKPLRYTRHARNRMRWRRLSTDEIAECIGEPEGKEKRPSGRMNCWKLVRGQWLRAVYVEEGDVIIVVTVIYPARGPKGRPT